MDDEPLIEIDNGSRFYRNKFRQYHRLDGPAIEYANGCKEWWQYGKYHRLDGPAVEIRDYKAWWKNGRKFPDKDSFFEALTEEEKKIALFSEDFLNG
jgi:hypothetical protein